MTANQHMNKTADAAPSLKMSGYSHNQLGGQIPNGRQRNLDFHIQGQNADLKN